MLVISYSYFLQSLGSALLSSLWQMALLWVIYKILISAFTQLISERKTAMATGLIISGFGWFLFTLISNFFFKKTYNDYSGWTTLLNEYGWNTFVQNLISACSVIYLFILVIPVWKFIRNYNNVQVIRKNGLQKISVEWKLFVEKIASNMGIIRKVQIWISDIVKTPVTIGYLKPIILIPVAAINHLSTHQVEAIILHELNHIRRYDYLFNLLINFIKTILYFNPFVKLFVKSIERERELSCDEMVIRYQYQPAEYASALLLLQKSKHQLMMLAAGGKDHDLLHRIESILGIGKKRTYSIRQILIPFATLLLLVLINTLFSVNSKNEVKSFFTLNSNVSPYYFLNSQKNNLNAPIVSNSKNTKSSISNNDYSQRLLKNASEVRDFAENSEGSAYKFANIRTDIIPELPDTAELKLKETVGATKRILQEQEWNEIEKGYAEVYNTFEKEMLKKEYQKEVNRIDWNKLEDQLRLSYENINWDKVNTQLNESLAKMKLDSIQQQVNIAISDLGQLETWLKNNNTTSIPDTDISLEQVKDSQKKLKLQLDKIKVLKSRKVIRL